MSIHSIVNDIADGLEFRAMRAFAMLAASKELQALITDTDVNSYWSAQLSYERARGMLDTISDTLTSFVGTQEARKTMAAAAKAAGYNSPSAENQYQIHAGAALAKHPASVATYPKPQPTTYGRSGSNRTTAHPADRQAAEQARLPFSGSESSALAAACGSLYEISEAHVDRWNHAVNKDIALVNINIERANNHQPPIEGCDLDCALMDRKLDQHFANERG